MKVYEALTTEQLSKHREVLLWMVQEIDIELAKRASKGAEPWLPWGEWIKTTRKFYGQ